MAIRIRPPQITTVRPQPPQPPAEGLDPEQKFHVYVKQGKIPAGSLYAGQNPDDKTQPMYYETTPQQLQVVEKQFLKDSTGAPKYFSNLLVRAGLTAPARMTDTEWATAKRQADERGIITTRNIVELQQRWNTLSTTEQQKVLAIYYYQVPTEDRAIPISLPKTGMMAVGKVSEYVRTATGLLSKVLPPVLAIPTTVGVSVITTMGEMVAMLPLAGAELVLNPNFVRELAVGMKDFTADAGKGVAKADPWAIGQMAVIVGTLYLGAKPIVRAVAIRAPAMATKVKVALSNLDTAIKGRSVTAIRAAGADLKVVGRQVGGSEGSTLIRLGERTEAQAGYLKTTSVEVIRSIEMSLNRSIRKWYDPAWLEPGTVLKPRIQPALRPVLTKTRLDLQLAKPKPDISIMLQEVARAARESKIRKAVERIRQGKTEPRKPGDIETRPAKRYQTAKEREAAETHEAYRQTEAAKWREHQQAKRIVAKAKENEAKIRTAAEKTLAELKGMTKASAIIRVLESASATHLAAMFALGSRQMVDTLAALRTRQATKIIARVAPALQIDIKRAISTRTRGLTKGLTRTLTEGFTKTETKALTKTQVKARTDTLAAILTLQKVATQALTETLTKQAIKTVVAKKVAVKRKVAIKERVVTKPKPKPRPKKGRFIPPIIPFGSDGKPLTKEQIAGAVMWKQGFIYIMKYPPYDKKDVTYSTKPFAGIKVVTGVRSAYETIKRLGGRLPTTLKHDMGIVDVHIIPGKVKPTLRFVRDKRQARRRAKRTQPKATTPTLSRSR